MTNLTRKFAWGLILLLPALITNAQLIGSTFESALKTGKAELIYVYNDVEDFAKLDEDGIVRGILVDLMTEFESYLLSKYKITSNITFEQVKGSDFNEFLKTIKQSSQGVFGLSNTSITPKREEVYQFSQPYIDNISVLITNNSMPSLGSLAEVNTSFEGMVAVSVPSSTYLDRLLKIKESQFPAMKIELVSSGQDVIERVSADRKAFAVVDLLYYLEFFKNGSPIKRHKVGDELGDRFGILMPKDSDWKHVLDEFFSSGFMESSKYRIIVSNHLGASATRLISAESKTIE
ncbi:MAG: transporter substrate-binding domain-containing protein [Cyclobacteriaceae bacterium]